MVKKNFCVILLLLNVSIVNAQHFIAEILGGVTTSQVSGDQLAGFNKAGVIAGAGVNTALSKKVHLGFEIYFIQKGSRKQADVSKGDLTYYRLRLNYIEIPLVFEYHLTDKLSVDLGPSAGTLTTSSEEDENGKLVGQPPFIKYEVSVFGGFVYHFADSWGLHFRGAQSIAPVREHNGGAVYRLNRGQYNSVLLFALFYQIGNKKKNTND